MIAATSTSLDGNSGQDNDGRKRRKKKEHVVDDSMGQDNDGRRRRKKKEHDVDDSMDEMEEKSDNETEEGQLRAEMADMPLGRLIEMRDRLGIPLFNKALFNQETVRTTPLEQRWKESVRDKSAKKPREMSARVPISRFNRSSMRGKRSFDPRFDDRCGQFDDFLFQNNYDFLDKMKQKEKKMLKRELKAVKREDSVRAERIKESLKKLENQERSMAEKKRIKETLKTLRNENMERMRSGLKPRYLRRAELKMMNMQKKFDELQSTGRLDSYVKRKAKKTNRPIPSTMEWDN